jgi:DGQHR domain-containing protein
MTKTITVPAVKTTQKGHTLYLFSIDGKQLHEFAAVSQLARDEEGTVLGYQRPEVAAHIANIRRYIESDNAMLPNAIVLSFDTSVEFEGLNKKHPDLGTLTIPIPNGDGEPKPGFIVDGQQRSAAVRDAEVESFPLCVVAFLANGEEEQREQFVLVNSVKPLPKSLIYELLPGMGDGASLPPNILKRKLAALLTQRLNADTDSPFKGQVKMPSNPDGVVQDNTLMKMIEASVADGALSDFKDTENDTFEVEKAVALLKAFWRTVQQTFPDAWGLQPRLSRLSHAAGVLALGLVMDACVARHRERGLPGEAVFAEELAVLAPHCHWCDGAWNFGAGNKRPWNSIQSTPKDVNLLNDHLLALYKRLVWRAKK